MRARLLWVLVLALGCGRPKTAAPPMPDLAGPVAARSTREASFRRTAPVAEFERSFAIPTVIERRLSNGIRVLVVERRDLPIVALRVVSDRGLDQAERGIGEMYARLALRAAEGRPSWSVYESWNDMGAVFETSVHTDATIHEVQVLAKLVEPALELLGDLVRKPAFPSKLLSRAREVLHAKRTIELDAPEVQRLLAVRQALYPSGHPYRLPLPPSDAFEKTDADVLLAYHRYAFTPAHVTLVAVGDTTADAIVPLLERAFGSHGGPTIGPQAPPPDPPEPSGPRLVLIDRPGGTHAQLGVAWLGPNRFGDDAVALTMAEELLRVRAFDVLRAELGVTYGVHLTHARGRARAPIVIESAIEVERIGESIREVLAAARQLATNAVASEALELEKSVAVARVAQRFETLSATADAVASLAVWGRPLDWYSSWLTRVGETTAEEVRDAAAKWIPDTTARIVVVGDAKILRPQLEALGLGPIEIRPQVAVVMK